MIELFSNFSDEEDERILSILEKNRDVLKGLVEKFMQACEAIQSLQSSNKKKS